MYWGNLHGGSDTLAVAEAAKSWADSAHAGPSVLLTPDSFSAQRIADALRFFRADFNILNFPDWETLPYDTFSPHQDIISERLTALYQLPNLRAGMLIVPISTLMQRLAPPEHISAHSLVIEKKQRLNIDDMRAQLQHCGYRAVSQVMEHGEFAVRGAILDLYPMGSRLPYRIELFDDEIDTIRTFDPENQRSIEVIERVQLLPAHEYPMTDDAISQFRQAWRARFTGNPANCPIYQDISDGVSPQGIEYYLPLFFDNTVTLFDYMPDNSLLFCLGDLHQAAEHFWQEIKERHAQQAFDVTRPLLPPNDLFIASNELFARLNTFSRIDITHAEVKTTAERYNFNTEKPQDLSVNHKAQQPFTALDNYLKQHLGRVLLCAETAGRREVLLEMLTKIDVHPHAFANWREFICSNEKIGLTIAPLEEGINLIDPSLALIAESQLFGQQIMQRRRRSSSEKQYDSDAIVRNLSELHVGAPVVHIDNGVGRYLGLQHLAFGEHENEFLTLEYAGGDKLYVPVSSLHLISRYSGVDVEHAPINRLGNDQWSKAKQKAAERARDAAAELLDIYARRAARKGFEFKTLDDQYLAFANAFPFEETPDQAQAIDKTLQDMRSSKTMDRLVCGDVGFGKTEVAMRASFCAVQSGKQVAILVPTTLLAQQHYNNFCDRFADWPMQIELISRFRSAKQETDIVKRLEEGKIDIIIGTHKLIQGKLKFKDLGLMIIDEEHRFGVRQKEKLKSLRAEVDILTLTATPIPRTLNMAMAEIRDLSIIATPPAKRLSIKTFVRDYNNGLIKEALLRELLRGGQVYFIHNNVETIERRAQDLAELVPEARIAFAHGQMREKQLEKIMSDFYHQRHNVLLCTTIIETGIDVPTANTIIIENADRFGLAQMHQLRGRVGRSHHQAYAYLLTPRGKKITKDAQKRLDAIASLEDLGAGFTLATHDLEIRGAGELLGEEQSGQIQAVGFSLYTELLENAVEALKEGKEPALTRPLQHGTEIDLQITALIPEDYLPDVHTRLILYKRIASAKDKEALRELQVEMIDRFGLLPPATKNLFRITELKLKAQALGINRVEAGAKGGRVEFSENPQVDPAQIIKLIQVRPKEYKLDGPERLRFILASDSVDKRIAVVSEVLERLARTNTKRS